MGRGLRHGKEHESVPPHPLLRSWFGEQKKEKLNRLCLVWEAEGGCHTLGPSRGCTVDAHHRPGPSQQWEPAHPLPPQGPSLKHSEPLPWSQSSPSPVWPAAESGTEGLARAASLACHRSPEVPELQGSATSPVAQVPHQNTPWGRRHSPPVASGAQLCRPLEKVRQLLGPGPG